MSDENNITVSSPETGAVAPVATSLSERPENVPEKFWDVATGSVNQEALLKSYGELETQRSNDKPTDVNQIPETAIQKALKTAGLNQDDFSNEIAENGVLSEDSYTKLATAGYDKAMVDQYLAGAQVGEHQAQLAANDITEIKASVDNFDGMSAWAKANMPPEQLQTYNDMVGAGNKQQALAAVSWANSLYAASEGSEPTLLGGGETGTDFSAFRSVAEVTSAMRDVRYGKDEAYTHDVMKKVGRSNVF